MEPVVQWIVVKDFRQELGGFQKWEKMMIETTNPKFIAEPLKGQSSGVTIVYKN